MEYSEISSKQIIIDPRLQERRLGYRIVKRMFDIAASLVGLFLFSPLFLIIAIAIKIEDQRGPVFYSQIRLGKDKVPFRMFKFRSMVSNADQLLQGLLNQNEVDGAMFKIKDDPRITRVGRFIRKYSLDELPQLINVLTGWMSLVGPRPPLPREVSQYSEYDSQRLIVKPGCTGLWQATDRNNVDFDGMLNLDLIYIRDCSVGMDIKILLKTVLVFVHPNGAY